MDGRKNKLVAPEITPRGLTKYVRVVTEEQSDRVREAA